MRVNSGRISGGCVASQIPISATLLALASLGYSLTQSVNAIVENTGQLLSREDLHHM